MLPVAQKRAPSLPSPPLPAMVTILTEHVLRERGRLHGRKPARAQLYPLSSPALAPSSRGRAAREECGCMRWLAMLFPELKNRSRRVGAVASMRWRQCGGGDAAALT